jgi:hypothetical protein
MRAHPICKLEELEVAFCKHYQNVQTYEQVYMALQVIKQGGNVNKIFYSHLRFATSEFIVTGLLKQ